MAASTENLNNFIFSLVLVLESVTKYRDQEPKHTKA